MSYLSVYFIFYAISLLIFFLIFVKYLYVYIMLVCILADF